MSREIRITVADDEVFERMRRQKEALDLSWEEVLRRGLDESGTEADRPEQPLDPFSEDFGDRLRERIRASTATRGSRSGDPGDDRGRDPGPPHGGGPIPFDSDSIREFVRRQISAAVPDDPVRAAGSIDSELDRLADAEDATLRFPFLESSSAMVPLRVTLRTTGEGLEVEVVAVRRGKGTAGENRFPDEARQRIATSLADGQTATLAMQEGAETYDVVPAISWDRTEDGVPTVGDVTIEQVVMA